MIYYVKKDVTPIKAVMWDGEFEGKSFDLIEEIVGKNNAICVLNEFAKENEDQNVLAIFQGGYWSYVPFGFFVTEFGIMKPDVFRNTYVILKDDDENV